MKIRKGKRISYFVFIVSWLFLMPASEVPTAQGKMIKNLKSGDRFQVEEIVHALRKEAKNLSLLKRDLYLIYTSMTSLQAKERFELLGCQENMAHAKGVYTYLADMLEQFLLVKGDKISYYSYLEKDGIEEMKTSVSQYLTNIERARAQIKDKSALSLIDKTLETIGSSLHLLDRVIQLLNQHLEPEEAGARTDTRNGEYLMHRYLLVPLRARIASNGENTRGPSHH